MTLPTRRWTLPTALLVCLPLLTAAGCQKAKDFTGWPPVAFSDEGDYLPRASGPGLVVMDDHPIPDVPMPVGFVALPSRSSSDMAGNARRVTHVYQGRATGRDAIDFYRDHLDDFGWRFQRLDALPDGSSVQSYTKGPEMLRVQSVDDDGVLTIYIFIEPLPNTD
jgi:hypothetical protein